MTCKNAVKMILKVILGFNLSQVLWPSFLPKGFAVCFAQNILCPLQNKFRIHHLCTRDLNSLQYHWDLFSFLRPWFCQSIVRNTDASLLVQSGWNDVAGAGCLDQLQDASFFPFLIRKGRMTEFSKKRPFSLRMKQKMSFVSWMEGNYIWSISRIKNTWS